MKSANFVLLSSDIHAKLKLKPVSNYAFAKSSHLVSVVLHELPNMSANYPVVFVKTQDSGKFMPMALLGLEPNSNLFVSENGAWQPGAYIPAAFRRYPFALTYTGPETMALCIDVDSEFLSEEEGIALFNAQGQPSEDLQKIKGFVLELYQSEVLAEKFCEKLVELDLLVPNGIKVQGPDGVKQYDGSFIVDEQKLAALSVEDFMSLRDSGHLVAIYAHLISLLQIEKFGVLRSAISPKSRRGKK